MQPAFPFVDISTPVELLSTMITPENPAVLVRDFKTEKTFIIRDVIAKMPNSRTTGKRAASGVRPSQHLEHRHQGERQQGHGARLLVPLQQQQSGTARGVQRLRPLRGRW